MINKMTKLNEVYKEVENKKENTPKGKKKITMGYDEFCEEHKRLIEILREGSREELLAEAEKQEEELEEYEGEED